MRKIVIVLCPIFNDSTSFSLLLPEITQITSFQSDLILKFLIVDDGSLEEEKDVLRKLQKDNKNLEVLYLLENHGHQKAICIGLGHIALKKNVDYVIVMDSDGEDDPKYIKELITRIPNDTGFVIAARRKKRNESFLFILFYKIYLLVAKILIGKWLNFGNYMLIDRVALHKIIKSPFCTNNLVGTVLSSNLKLLFVDTNRRKRFSGNSKMNLSSYIIHGFAIMGIFSEIFLVRTFLVLAFSGLLLFTLSIILIFLKLFSSIAIPGWTSIIIAIIFSTLVQITLTLIMIMFLFLQKRNSSQNFEKLRIIDK